MLSSAVFPTTRFRPFVLSIQTNEAASTFQRTSTFEPTLMADVRVGSSVDMLRCPRQVCFTPNNRHRSPAFARQLWATSDILHRRKAASLSPIVKLLNLLDLLGSMQKPRSPNRLRDVVGLSGDLSKPAKMRARCRWRRKLGAADSGERAGRGRR